MSAPDEDTPRPDPLRALDGTPITTPAAWAEHRPALLELFREHIYGRGPIARISGVAYEIEEAAAIRVARAMPTAERARAIAPSQA